jgi:hypothetical protein
MWKTNKYLLNYKKESKDSGTKHKRQRDNEEESGISHKYLKNVIIEY